MTNETTATGTTQATAARPRPAWWRRALKRLVFISIPFIVFLVIIEIGLRVAQVRPPGFSELGDPAEQALVEAHPTRGFAYRAGVTADVTRLGRTLDVETDEHGFRVHAPVRGDGTPRVLAIGDSFTVGWGVGSEESWTARLESELRGRRAEWEDVRVMNAGVSGYSLRQIRIAAEEHLDSASSSAPLVVVGAYPAAAWRLDDPYVMKAGVLVKSSRQHHIEEIGGVAYYSPFSSAWQRTLDGFLARYCWVGAFALRGVVAARRALAGADSTPATTVFTEPDLTAYLHELDSLHVSVSGRGSRLLVLLVNHQEEDGAFGDDERARRARVLAHCESAGIECVDVLPAFEREAGGEPRFRLPGDQHWSPEGHALAARLVADAIERGEFLRDR